MSTNIAPFAGSGISAFKSYDVAFFTTTSDSLCMSFMLLKFEQTSMMFSNLTDAKNKGMEVVLPMEQDKGKDVVPPLEVVPQTTVQVPPTNDDVVPEEPSSVKRRNYDQYMRRAGGPTHFYKVIMALKLEAVPMA
ncbi:cohesin subunit sa-1 [Hordeum vulgare]|nr:cohesin subunit sa-1 [Hordeum vulgare]